jgi:hypothetical protein
MLQLDTIFRQLHRITKRSSTVKYAMPVLAQDNQQPEAP